MSWGIFTLALLVTCLLQTAVVGFFNLGWMDLFLALALVYGLTASVQDARIAAWIIGLVQDLGSQDALGVHAFALGLVGVVVTALRVLVNLSMWWVRLLVGLLAALAGTAVYLLHLHLWERAAFESWSALISSSAWTALVAAGIAALLTGSGRVVAGRRRRGYVLPAPK